MELNIESQINQKELYHFLMHHAYSTIWGFTGIIISVCAMLAFIQLCLTDSDMISKVCVLVTALLFLVIQPLRLYLQSMRQMINDPGYQKPIRYQLNHSGIHLSQEEDQAFYTWDQVEKVISTKQIVAIYVSNKRVFKISRREIGDQYEELKKIFHAYAVKAVIKLK